MNRRCRHLGTALRRRAVAAAALWRSGPAVAQKTELLVYTALETDQIKAYEDAFYKAYPDIDDQVGARFHRRDHRQAPRRKGQSAGRHGGRHLGVEPCRLRQRGDAAAATRRRAWTRSCRSTAIPKNPPEWVGMDVYGAAICFNTVEAAKLEPAQARDLEGPDQARLQGQDRDAESRLVGHRLPGRRGLAADVGRCRRVEVHGRAARQRRAVHALRLASRAARPAPASSRSAFRSNIAP